MWAPAARVPAAHDALPAATGTSAQPAGVEPSTVKVTVPVGIGAEPWALRSATRVTGSCTVAPEGGDADSETPGTAVVTP